LLLKAAQDRRAAGSEHLDLDAVFFLERFGDLLALLDRRRGVPDDLALGLRLGDVNGVLRVGGGETEGADQDDRAKQKHVAHRVAPWLAHSSHPSCPRSTRASIVFRKRWIAGSSPAMTWRRQRVRPIAARSMPAAVDRRRLREEAFQHVVADLVVLLVER